MSQEFWIYGAQETSDPRIRYNTYHKQISMTNYRLTMSAPSTCPGCDFVGTVVAKGKGDSVRFLEVGEEVFGQVFMGSGTFAEYVICPSSNLTKKPSNISSVEAAAMPFVSQTAYQALQTMKLNDQSKLLILGGSSSVGCAAIQIAKNHFECDEVVVTSSRPEMCMELGV